jgi:hypothetical protein
MIRATNPRANPPDHGRHGGLNPPEHPLPQGIAAPREDKDAWFSESGVTCFGSELPSKRVLDGVFMGVRMVSVKQECLLLKGI